MNMAGIFTDGLKDFTKAEEMFRHALDGYEKSLGKDHERRKRCAKNLAVLLEKIGTRKQDLRNMLDEYPHLEQTKSWDV